MDENTPEAMKEMLSNLFEIGQGLIDTFVITNNEAYRESSEDYDFLRSELSALGDYLQQM